MSTNIEINVPNSSGTYSAYHPETSIDNIVELKRKKSTVYTVGDIAYHSTLPAGWYLKCTTAGTTSNSNLTINSPAINNIVTDGTAKWTIKSIDPEGKYLPLSGGNLTGNLGSQYLYEKHPWYKASESFIPENNPAYASFDFKDNNEETMVNILTWQNEVSRGGGRGYAIRFIDQDGELNSPFSCSIDIPSKKLHTHCSDPDINSYDSHIANTKWVREVGHYENASSHNAHYRGKNITDYEASGEMSTAIANGSFTNIYPGDYIIKSVTLPAITYTNKSGTSITQAAQTFNNVAWIVAGCDSRLYVGGDTPLTTHHAVLVPSTALQRNVSMNPTDTTAGGYLGSDMWKVHMTNWTNAIKNAFGTSHVLKHQELLTDSIDANLTSNIVWESGTANSATWTDVYVNIPDEIMIFGTANVSSSFFDRYAWGFQLPLFAMKGNYLNDRNWCWLRTIASSKRFGTASVSGSASVDFASASYGGGGIFPYFLYK